MSQPAALSANQVATEATPPVIAAVFVVSLGSLLLELALTRLFSVILFYHFAFLAISIALLGLGAGGVFAYLRRNWLARWKIRELGAAISLLNAVAVVVALVVILRIPVSLQLSWQNFWRLTAIYVLSGIAFFGTGVIFSTLFARESREVGLLYAADLGGGSVACLAVVPLLNNVGGPNTVIAAAVLMAVAALIWSTAMRLRVAAGVVCAVLVCLVVGNHSGRLIDIVYAKGNRQSNVEFARWNAISRVQVAGDPSGAKIISIDADATTYIASYDPSEWKGSEYERAMMSSPAAVVNALRPDGEYAIIGPGGGVDVVRAVASGSPSVTGIEINALIADTIMRDRYAAFSNRLYSLPQVHMHVSDGRSWIRGTAQRFDVVQMTLVDTWASTAAGAFALSENSLYTVEAFAEYLNHLRPDGLIAITRWEFAQPREALRVVSVAMEALRRAGVTDPAKHFVVVSEGELNVDGIPVTVIAKKSPFTADEEQRVIAHLKRNPKLKAVYLPSESIPSPFQQLIASRDPYQFSSSYRFNVKPVTDNAPFFFFTVKSADLLKGVIGQGMDFKVNAAVTVLGIVFVLSVLAVAMFLVVPLWRATGVRPNSKPLLYFVAVGLGYILVEIAFIQRFVLFLGHPTYALTVVVFLMLLASGLGSLASRQLFEHPRRIRIPVIAVIVVVLAYALLLPSMLASLVHWPFAAKLAICFVVLFPVAFAMGMPFPAGIRALAGSGEETIEWAWALNAGASVLGSVLAMVVAIQFGLTVTMAAGAAAYGVAALLVSTFGAVTEVERDEVVSERHRVAS